MEYRESLAFPLPRRYPDRWELVSPPDRIHKCAGTVLPSTFRGRRPGRTVTDCKIWSTFLSSNRDIPGGRVICGENYGKCFRHW